MRDPHDAYLVDLGRSSGADMQVSLDRDLLDAQLADVTVLDPAQFFGPPRQRAFKHRCMSEPWCKQSVNKPHATRRHSALGGLMNPQQ